MKFLHIFLNSTQSGCKPSNFLYILLHTLAKSSCPYPYSSPPPPPHFYRPTPNHPHSYAPDVQTTSICHTTSATICIPKDLTNPHFAFYPSMTPHIHLTIILSSLYRFSAFIAMHRSHTELRPTPFLQLSK